MRDYDSKQLRALYHSELVDTIVVCAMHCYYGQTRRLLPSIVVNCKDVLVSNVIRIHVFGEEPKNELQSCKRIGSCK